MQRMTRALVSAFSRRSRLLCTTLWIAGGVAGIAQQPAASAPQTAEQIMSRVAAMNEQRASKLESYTSIRAYHLESHGLVSKTADMVIRADYRAPDQKQFTIVSESGSGSVRNRVFRRLLHAELESMQPANQQQSALTAENYVFQLVSEEETGDGDFFVIEAQPRNKNQFLFAGRIWVDARDFAVTKVEGQPAVNPSWWTLRTDFTRAYQRVGEFWLPESNSSITKVRMFGTATLTINYREYQITQTGDETNAPVTASVRGDGLPAAEQLSLSKSDLQIDSPSGPR